MHVQNLCPNPTTKAVQKGRFQPQYHLGNHLTDFDDTLNYGTARKDYIHAKFDFDPTTWVVWAPVCHCKVSFFVFVSHRMRQKE